jgi:hypothetical protein
MVAECCTERSWLAGMQPHLVHYVPQAVPFFSWVAWPPFFDHPFYSILPIIALPAFIFYDALAGFNGAPAASHDPPPLPPPWGGCSAVCVQSPDTLPILSRYSPRRRPPPFRRAGPSSYAMGPRKTRETFPQLSDVLYSAVYCEAMHNDARTGTVRHNPSPSPPPALLAPLPPPHPTPPHPTHPPTHTHIPPHSHPPAPQTIAHIRHHHCPTSPSPHPTLTSHSHSHPPYPLPRPHPYPHRPSRSRRPSKAPPSPTT